MRAIEMIESKLIEMGADGLVNIDIGCECEIDDLIPCATDCANCVAARKDKGDAFSRMIPICRDEVTP